MDFPAHIPFAIHLGLELVRIGEGEAELLVDLRRPELLNSFSVGHGGALMTVLDVAMAHAARSHNPPPQYAPGAVTIEMKTSFLRAATGRLRVTGRIVHRTPTLCFCEATACNEAGEACATASGTFKLMRAMPADDHAVHALQGGKSPA